MSWQLDPTHSSVAFSVRHMVVARVKGRFKEFSVSLAADEKDLTASRLKAEIRADSVDTGVEQRDGHLKSPDFFDVAKFPTITFESSRVEKHGDGHRVAGSLSMHGVTRPVTLEVEGGFGKDPWGNRRAMFSARTSVERKDFGLTWNQALETGGVLVGDKVEIELDVELVDKQ
ncbi:MAG: YceI family protein [Deltaproteobacteria bacterium]|nr:YceI family protein [Deltaproteobacteria bacterium]